MYGIDIMYFDVCMCKGIDCPLKDKCLRYNAKPSKLQTYFTEIQYQNGKCEYFVDYKNIEDKLNKKRE